MTDIEALHVCEQAIRYVGMQVGALESMQEFTDYMAKRKDLDMLYFCIQKEVPAKIEYGDNADTWECPRCGKKMSWEEVHYCPICGQKILWEKDKKYE